MTSNENEILNAICSAFFDMKEEERIILEEQEIIKKYEKCIKFAIDNRNLSSDELLKGIKNLVPKESKFYIL